MPIHVKKVKLYSKLQLTFQSVIYEEWFNDTAGFILWCFQGLTHHTDDTISIHCPICKKTHARSYTIYKQRPRKHTINADERNYWHQQRTSSDCGLYRVEQGKHMFFILLDSNYGITVSKKPARRHTHNALRSKVPWLLKLHCLTCLPAHAQRHQPHPRWGLAIWKTCVSSGPPCTLSDHTQYDMFPAVAWEFCQHNPAQTSSDHPSSYITGLTCILTREYSRPSTSACRLHE